MAPASMPESLATTMQRTPLMKPMPATTPPPATDLAGSFVSCRKPASVHSGNQGAPASSSSAMRSRGSNWPRLSNTGLAWADAAAARSSSARSWAMRSSMAARRSCAASLCGLKREAKLMTGTPWAARSGESRRTA